MGVVQSVRLHQVSRYENRSNSLNGNPSDYTETTTKGVEFSLEISMLAFNDIEGPKIEFLELMAGSSPLLVL